MKRAKRTFTAAIFREEVWWVGFIEEIPGVNCQERTRKELRESLRSALEEALEIRRELAFAEVREKYEEQPILV